MNLNFFKVFSFLTFLFSFSVFATSPDVVRLADRAKNGDLAALRELIKKVQSTPKSVITTQHGGSGNLQVALKAALEGSKKSTETQFHAAAFDLVSRYTTDGLQEYLSRQSLSDSVAAFGERIREKIKNNTIPRSNHVSMLEGFVKDYVKKLDDGETDEELKGKISVLADALGMEVELNQKKRKKAGKPSYKTEGNKLSVTFYGPEFENNTFENFKQDGSGATYPLGDNLKQLASKVGHDLVYQNADGRMITRPTGPDMKLMADYLASQNGSQDQAREVFKRYLDTGGPGNGDNEKVKALQNWVIEQDRAGHPLLAQDLLIDLSREGKWDNTISWLLDQDKKDPNPQLRGALRGAYSRLSDKTDTKSKRMHEILAANFVTIGDQAGMEMVLGTPADKYPRIKKNIVKDLDRSRLVRFMRGKGSEGLTRYLDHDSISSLTEREDIPLAQKIYAKAAFFYSQMKRPSDFHHTAKARELISMVTSTMHPRAYEEVDKIIKKALESPGSQKDLLKDFVHHMGRSGDANFFPFIRNIVDQKNVPSDVRMEAAMALLENGDSGHIRKLLADKDLPDSIKTAILDKIESLGPQGASIALGGNSNLLNDSSVSAPLRQKFQEAVLKVGNLKFDGAPTVERPPQFDRRQGFGEYANALGRHRRSSRQKHRYEQRTRDPASFDSALGKINGDLGAGTLLNLSPLPKKGSTEQLDLAIEKMDPAFLGRTAGALMRKWADLYKGPHYQAALEREKYKDLFQRIAARAKSFSPNQMEDFFKGYEPPDLNIAKKLTKTDEDKSDYSNPLETDATFMRDLFPKSARGKKFNCDPNILLKSASNPYYGVPGSNCFLAMVNAHPLSGPPQELADDVEKAKKLIEEDPTNNPVLAQFMDMWNKAPEKLTRDEYKDFETLKNMAGMLPVHIRKLIEKENSIDLGATSGLAKLRSEMKGNSALWTKIKSTVETELKKSLAAQKEVSDLFLSYHREVGLGVKSYPPEILKIMEKWEKEGVPKSILGLTWLTNRETYVKNTINICFENNKNASFENFLDSDLKKIAGHDVLTQLYFLRKGIPEWLKGRVGIPPDGKNLPLTWEEFLKNPEIQKIKDPKLLAMIRGHFDTLVPQAVIKKRLFQNYFLVRRAWAKAGRLKLVLANGGKEIPPGVRHQYDETLKAMNGIRLHMAQMQKQFPFLIDKEQVEALDYAAQVSGTNELKTLMEEEAKKNKPAWYAEVGHGLAGAVEGIANLVNTNVAMYGSYLVKGGAYGLGLSDEPWNWEKSVQVGADYFDMNRKFFNENMGGSIFGDDNKFASMGNTNTTLGKIQMAMAVNPMGQLGKSIGGLLQGVDVGYYKLVGAMQGRSGDEQRDVMAKMDSWHGSAARFSLGVSKLAAGTALFLSTGTYVSAEGAALTGGELIAAQASAAGQMYASSFGLSLVSSIGSELSMLGDQKKSFGAKNLWNVITNSAQGTADSALFMGAMAFTGKMAVRAGMSQANAAVLSEAIDIAEGMGELPDIAKQMNDVWIDVKYHKGRNTNSKKILGLALTSFATAYDMGLDGVVGGVSKRILSVESTTDRKVMQAYLASQGVNLNSNIETYSLKELAQLAAEKRGADPSKIDVEKEIQLAQNTIMLLGNSKMEGDDLKRSAGLMLGTGKLNTQQMNALIKARGLDAAAKLELLTSKNSRGNPHFSQELALKAINMGYAGIAKGNLHVGMPGNLNSGELAAMDSMAKPPPASALESVDTDSSFDISSAETARMPRMTENIYDAAKPPEGLQNLNLEGPSDMGRALRMMGKYTEAFEMGKNNPYVADPRFKFTPQNAGELKRQASAMTKELIAKYGLNLSETQKKELETKLYEHGQSFNQYMILMSNNVESPNTHIVLDRLETAEQGIASILGGRRKLGQFLINRAEAQKAAYSESLKAFESVQRSYNNETDPARKGFLFVELERKAAELVLAGHKLYTDARIPHSVASGKHTGEFVLTVTPYNGTSAPSRYAQHTAITTPGRYLTVGAMALHVQNARGVYWGNHVYIALESLTDENIGSTDKHEIRHAKYEQDLINGKYNWFRSWMTMLDGSNLPFNDIYGYEKGYWSEEVSNHIGNLRDYSRDVHKILKEVFGLGKNEGGDVLSKLKELLDSKKDLKLTESQRERIQEQLGKIEYRMKMVRGLATGIQRSSRALLDGLHDGTTLAPFFYVESMSDGHGKEVDVVKVKLIKGSLMLDVPITLSDAEKAQFIDTSTTPASIKPGQDAILQRLARQNLINMEKGALDILEKVPGVINAELGADNIPLLMAVLNQTTSAPVVIARPVPTNKTAREELNALVAKNKGREVSKADIEKIGDLLIEMEPNTANIDGLLTGLKLSMKEKIGSRLLKRNLSEDTLNLGSVSSKAKTAILSDTWDLGPLPTGIDPVTESLEQKVNELSMNRENNRILLQFLEGLPGDVQDSIIGRFKSLGHSQKSEAMTALRNIGLGRAMSSRSPASSTGIEKLSKLSPEGVKSKLNGFEFTGTDGIKYKVEVIDSDSESVKFRVLDPNGITAATGERAIKSLGNGDFGFGEGRIQLEKNPNTGKTPERTGISKFLASAYYDMAPAGTKYSMESTEHNTNTFVQGAIERVGKSKEYKELIANFEAAKSAGDEAKMNEVRLQAADMLNKSVTQEARVAFLTKTLGGAPQSALWFNVLADAGWKSVDIRLFQGYEGIRFKRWNPSNLPGQGKKSHEVPVFLDASK